MFDLQVNIKIDSISRFEIETHKIKLITNYQFFLGFWIFTMSNYLLKS